jgi:hypothetical protein
MAVVENSKIEWTDLCGWLRIAPQRRLVRKRVAPLAKSNPVARVEPELWVRRERQNVVGIQIPATIIPAMGARETVAPIHIIAPTLQVCGEAKATPLDAVAVNVAGRVSSSERSLARLLADLCAKLSTQFDALAWVRPPLSRCAHFLTCIGAMASAFERARSAFRRTLFRHSRTSEAPRRETIKAGAIATELLGGLPVLALRASLHAVADAPTILIKRDSSFLRRSFCGSI